MIPVMIVGLFFRREVQAVYGAGAVILVGGMLMVTAVLLSLTHYIKFKERRDISYLDSLLIGVSQAIAVLPGLSRSGITISTGLLLGNRKEEIAQFSFLMVLIPILGKAILDILHGKFSQEFSGIPIPVMMIGFVAAFASGWLACKAMIALVKRSKLIYFAIYCAIVGVISLIWQFFV